MLLIHVISIKINIGPRILILMNLIWSLKFLKNSYFHPFSHTISIMKRNENHFFCKTQETKLIKVKIGN